MADDAAAGSGESTGASREELEARVRELEAELDRKRPALEEAGRQASRGERRSESRSEPRTDRRDTVESSREVADRAFAEASRLLRAVTLAQVEGLRAVADAVSAFANEVATRREAGDGDREAAARLPADLYAGYLKAVDEALKIPERTNEKFQESYRPTRAEDRDADSGTRSGDAS